MYNEIDLFIRISFFYIYIKHVAFTVEDHVRIFIGFEKQ